MLEYPAALGVATPRPESPRGARPTPLSTVLQPGDVLLELDVPTKNLAFKEIHTSSRVGMALVSPTFYDGLVKRERIGSTALGLGIAIPRARIRRLDRPVAAYVRTRSAIPFDAPDDRPVSDMLVLLVPEKATDEHLQLLAEVADLFCVRNFREQLRACNDPDMAYALLTRT